MRIVRLKKEQREYFLDMDPFYLMERLEFPGSFALAALAENETESGEIPAGLMICTLKSDRLVIEWLCVVAAYRMKGIGEQLLTEAFEAARQGKLQTVCAAISREGLRERIYPEDERFFKQRLFVERRSLPGEWLTDVRTIASIPYFKRKPEEGFKVYPLRHLTGTKRSEAIAALAGPENQQVLYPLKDGGDLLDQDVSLLLLAKGRPCGACLVQCVTTPVYQVHAGSVMKTGEHQTLYPVLFYAGSDRAAGVLLSAVVREAERKYVPDTAIRVVIRDSNYGSLMEKLVPEAHIDSWFLTAQVADYVLWNQVKKNMNR